MLVKDINSTSATASSSPYNYDQITQADRFAIMGGAFYFRANDGRRGDELHMIDPGDTSQSIGHACPDASKPSISATDPVLGANITLGARGKPGTTGMLLIGLPKNRLNTGAWSLTALIPNNAAQKGSQLMIQAAFGPTSTLPFGVDLTGGARLTLCY